MDLPDDVIPFWRFIFFFSAICKDETGQDGAHEERGVDDIVHVQMTHGDESADFQFSEASVAGPGAQKDERNMTKLSHKI